ncbi:MAG: YkgJ family cysteine cluster protein [Nonomuraea sp.]|nr:YkgJ family cysteine cluster protein [Nonomuraea sp.]
MIDQTVLDQLQELYDSLPTIACQGKCANSCGPIDMSTAEHTRIVELGVLIPTFTVEASQRWADQEPLHCPALNRQTLKCDVYEARPLICRLWGVADSMPCTYGCQPSRVLSDVETYELMLRSFEIGGHRQLRPDSEMRRMLDMLVDPTVGPLMSKFIRGDRSVESDLIEAIAAARG